MRSTAKLQRHRLTVKTIHLDLFKFERVAAITPMLEKRRLCSSRPSCDAYLALLYNLRRQAQS